MTKDDIVPYLEDLQQRRTTNKAVAALLHVSPETVSRVFKQLRGKKIPGVTKTRKENSKKLTKARYEFRTNAAATLSVEAAVRATGLTERSVRRWKARVQATQTTPPKATP